MRVWLPIFAVGLAAYSAWKSVTRKARFVQNFRYHGWLAPRQFRRKHVDEVFFMIRIRGEQYSTYTSMYVPTKVSEVNFDRANCSVGDVFRGDLDGGFMHLVVHVPWKYVDEADGYRVVKKEYQFETFCKKHGVKMSRMIWVINDYRREFYRRLVSYGAMSEEDVV